VFRVALYILKKLERELLALEFGEAFQLLKHVSQHKLLADTNKFIRGALEINLRRAEISELRARYQAANSKDSNAIAPLSSSKSSRVEDSPSSDLPSNNSSFAASPVKDLASNSRTPLATPRG